MQFSTFKYMFGPYVHSFIIFWPKLIQLYIGTVIYRLSTLNARQSERVLIVFQFQCAEIAHWKCLYLSVCVLICPSLRLSRVLFYIKPHILFSCLQLCFHLMFFSISTFIFRLWHRLNSYQNYFMPFNARFSSLFWFVFVCYSKY